MLPICPIFTMEGGGPITDQKVLNFYVPNRGRMHRRNEERGQGGPWAPPIRSKMGLIKSKMGWRRTKMGPFRGPVFHEKTSGKSKFSSKGAEFSWAPPIL